MEKYFLAIDIGASSGRHILGSIVDGKFVLEEIYRFKNGAFKKDGKYCWDWQSLFSSILAGIKKCKDLNKIPVSIGIDTWGVDYALLDKDGKIIGDIYSYRDDRTNKTMPMVHDIISDKELYKRTGIQKQVFNTIYQLYDDKLTGKIDNAEYFLNVPDFLNYLLTGVMKNEFSEASTTSLINGKTGDWDYELIEKLGYKKSMFRNLENAGTIVGDFTLEVQKEVGFNSKVILIPSHDTASAIMSVPEIKDYVYISSGTWSLMGILMDEALTDDIAFKASFTNERGYDGKVTFLKNIMGLWMIQCIRKDYNDKYDFFALVDEARKSSDFKSVVDVNDMSFFAPDSMVQAVKDYCKKTNQQVPESVGEVAFCVYNSLALSYKEAISNLEIIAGKKFNSINIVGGGCQNVLLNELTAKHTGKKVVAGPVEGTAIGNLLSQMIAFNEVESLEDGKKIIKQSFSIVEYE